MRNGRRAWGREKGLLCDDIIMSREGYEVRESEVIDAWCNQDMELRGERGKATEKRERETDRCDVQRFWMLNIACFPLTTYWVRDWLLSASTNTHSSLLSIIQIALSFPPLSVFVLLSICLYLILFVVLHGCVLHFSVVFGTRMSLYSPIQRGLVLENESRGMGW